MPICKKAVACIDALQYCLFRCCDTLLWLSSPCSNNWLQAVKYWTVHLTCGASTGRRLWEIYVCNSVSTSFCWKDLIIITEDNVQCNIYLHDFAGWIFNFVHESCMMWTSRRRGTLLAAPLLHFSHSLMYRSMISCHSSVLPSNWICFVPLACEECRAFTMFLS